MCPAPKRFNDLLNDINRVCRVGGMVSKQHRLFPLLSRISAGRTYTTPSMPPLTTRPPKGFSRTGAASRRPFGGALVFQSSAPSAGSFVALALLADKLTNSRGLSKQTRAGIRRTPAPSSRPPVFSVGPHPSLTTAGGGASYATDAGGVFAPPAVIRASVGLAPPAWPSGSAAAGGAGAPGVAQAYASAVTLALRGPAPRKG